MNRYNIAIGKTLSSIENSDDVGKIPFTWYGMTWNNKGKLIVSDGTNIYEQVGAYFERIDNG